MSDSNHAYDRLHGVDGHVQAGNGCRFGYVEYDATQYCHEHGGFRDLHGQTRLCDRAPASLPLHRTEAGFPRCSTCDGGGCPDCTDSA